ALPISLPGAFRRGDGIPPPDGAIDPPVAGDGAAAARRRPGGRGTARRRRATTTGGRDGRQGGPMTVEETSRQRTGGRAGRQAARSEEHIAREPFLTRTLAPFEVLDEEGLSLIEENADTILQEVGLEF